MQVIRTTIKTMTKILNMFKTHHPRVEAKKNKRLGQRT